MGSSPRMRGTQSSIPDFQVLVGLIPTYAGNTIRGKDPVLRERAHPHVCGEHVEFTTPIYEESGSSPRMRGTQLATIRLSVSEGLIPTYAGNTRFLCRCLGFAWAHPHVCGEHRRAKGRKHAGAGSSPRMRGTLRHSRGYPKSSWLIPTYAGNTLCSTPNAGARRAHPHVCGEHTASTIPLNQSKGSSPRMRGTQPDGHPELEAKGLIPTYAGNTLLGVCAALFAGAHPHVCGEHH